MLSSNVFRLGPVLNNDQSVVICLIQRTIGVNMQVIIHKLGRDVIYD